MGQKIFQYFVVKQLRRSHVRLGKQFRLNDQLYKGIAFARCLVQTTDALAKKKMTRRMSHLGT